MRVPVLFARILALVILLAVDLVVLVRPAVVETPRSSLCLAAYSSWPACLKCLATFSARPGRLANTTDLLEMVRWPATMALASRMPCRMAMAAAWLGQLWRES